MQPIGSAALPVPDSRRVITIRIVMVVGLIAMGALSFFLMPTAIDILTSITKSYDRRNIGYIVMWFIAFCINGSPISVASLPVALTSGFLYGWWAFPLGYCGLILGAHVSIRIVRWLAGNGHVSVTAVRQMFGSYSEKIVAFEQALKEHGVQMVALLQLSVLPFGILNGLLGLTEVKLSQHFLATMVTRTKLLLYVWIGMSAPDIAVLIRDLQSGSFDFRSARTILFSLVIVFTFVAFVMIFIHVRKQLRRFQQPSQSVPSSPDPSEMATSQSTT